MGLAEMVDAPVLLVGDIDRGGVFAQLYGTVELLEEKRRRRIKGLVINKFRGDVEILRPGLAMLEEKTHLPVVGVVPYLKVDIEDEDSLSQRLEMRDAKSRWMRRSSVCRICPILRTSYRWNSTCCWACGMWRIYGRWGFRILCSCPAPKKYDGRSAVAASKRDGGGAAAPAWGPGVPFWACAAVIRCWEKRWTIPKVPRAVVRAACAVWGCCRCGRCSPAKKHAPGLPLWHWRNPLPGRGWKGMRSIWAVQRAGKRTATVPVKCRRKCKWQRSQGYPLWLEPEKPVWFLCPWRI